MGCQDFSILVERSLSSCCTSDGTIAHGGSPGDDSLSSEVVQGQTQSNGNKTAINIDSLLIKNYEKNGAKSRLAEQLSYTNPVPQKYAHSWLKPGSH